MENKIKTAQDLIIAFIFLFFVISYSAENYTSFSEAPPNVWDKVYYTWEALLFLGFSWILIIVNQCLEAFTPWKMYLYVSSWKCITKFLALRFIWELVWITFGLSANMKIAERVFFVITFICVFYLTFLPKLKKTV